MGSYEKFVLGRNKTQLQRRSSGGNEKRDWEKSETIASRTDVAVRNERERNPQAAEKKVLVVSSITSSLLL